MERAAAVNGRRCLRPLWALLAVLLLSPGAAAEDAAPYRGLLAPHAMPVVSEAPPTALLRGESLPPSYGFVSADGALRVTGQTPVKDQGANGTCWAFSAMAAAEANMLLHGVGGDAPDLSEAHMIYALRRFGATKTDLSNTAQGYAYDPAEAGNIEYAASYLMRGTALGGTLTEDADPYTYLSRGIPGRAIEETARLGESKAYTVENIPVIVGEKTAVYDGSDEAALREADAVKRAVMEYGAVSTSLYWRVTAANYRAETGAYYAPGGTAPNHAITIVGWDDAYGAERFATTPPADGAWLVKNSWGAGDGRGADGSGYYWVSYCDPLIGALSYAVDGVHPYDANELVHEYDYRVDEAVTSDYGYVVAFPRRTAAERVEAVRVFLFTAGTFDVSVCTAYTPGAADAVEEQAFTHRQTVTMDRPGFYTVALDEPALIDGDWFAVRLDLASRATRLYTYAPEAVPTLSGADGTYDAVFRRARRDGAWQGMSELGEQGFVPCIKAVTRDLTGNRRFSFTAVEPEEDGVLVRVDTDMARPVLLAAAVYRSGRLEDFAAQTAALRAESGSYRLSVAADEGAEIAVFALDPKTLAPIAKSVSR